MNVHEKLAQAIRERDQALQMITALQGLVARANRVLETYLEMGNRVGEQEERQKAKDTAQ